MARILVVEDEALIARDLQQILRGLGHEVPAIAGSADEALRAAEKSPPDLVLMDVHLRGLLDGIATAGKLRERWDPALIFLTAYADDETVKRARVVQPEGYLLKPFNEDELRSTIEIALYKHAMARKLRESERWFKAALGAIGDAVLTVDGEKRVTFMNTVAEGLTGFLADEAKGRPLDEVLPIDRRGSPVLTARDGSSIPIDETISPIPSDGGEVAGAVIVVRDMRSVRALHERLALADRLSALGTLATGVAHEINNPLTYIASNAGYARDVLGGLGPERVLTERQLGNVHEALCDTMEGVDRVRAIVDDLSAFVRGGAQGNADCEIRAPIEAALKMAAHELTPRARLTTLFAPGLPRVAAPEQRLAQVFLNLIVNALQAMPHGAQTGHLRIETRPGKDGFVEVLVADDGAGMQPEVLRRIFEPFYTTQPVGSGKGLGLSLSHGIVTGLGGELSARSEPGVGTEFRVLLPAVAETREPPRERPARARRGAVLLVRDEQVFPEPLRQALGAHHEITLASSGRDALGRVGLGERFDAIVCDLESSELPGERLYGEIRTLDPAQAERIVFVRGATTLPGTRYFLQAVHNAQLEKPILADRLIEEVTQLVG